MAYSPLVWAILGQNRATSMPVRGRGAEMGRIAEIDTNDPKR
jgi:hypothetical protein